MLEFARARPRPAASYDSIPEAMSQLPLWGDVAPSRRSIKSLSKSRIAAGLQCAKRLYLECYESERRDPYDPSRQALFDAARQVAVAARARFPGGVVMSEDPIRHEDAVRATRAALSDPTVPAVYEAAFTHDEIRVRVDILARTPDGAWDLIEVKASKQIKEDYLPDVAIQLHVVEGAGVPVRQVCVLNLNGDYVWEGGDYDAGVLFSLHELTRDARRRIPDLLHRVVALRAHLWSTMAPSIAIGVHCVRPYRCPFYGTCHEDEAEHPIHTLPRMDPRLRSRLETLGISDIRQIPEDFDGLSILQRRVRDCLLQGVPFLDAELGRALTQLRYPIHFLDFESCSPPLPVIPGTRPFQQTPFQWSDHVLHVDGTVEHREYLHESRTDPRRPLAEALLRSLADAGAIMVYSGFEERTMRGLAEALPDLGEALLAHVGVRIVDLHRLIHAHYYHPKLRGSFSIKDVLPVLVQGIGYGDLSIKDGSQAALAFSAITDPAKDRLERDRLCEQLRAYCRRDTEAMMCLFQALREDR
jgi:hypothetical protein